MTIHHVEQGSPEWFAARCGKVTASRVADIMRRTKSGISASRANYMAQLVCERLTGNVAEGFTSAAMEWGSLHEPACRAAYEFLTDCDIELVGSVDHPSIPMASGSPDGFVGADGMIEMKCPITATHIDTLLGQPIPPDYETQMMWNMACNPRRAWCDFLSFDPRMPAPMQLFRKRVMRDEARIRELELAVRKFLAELDVKVAELKALYQRKAAA
jgi:putative phage-type endonuclease